MYITLWILPVLALPKIGSRYQPDPLPSTASTLRTFSHIDADEVNTNDMCWSIYTAWRKSKGTIMRSLSCVPHPKSYQYSVRVEEYIDETHSDSLLIYCRDRKERDEIPPTEDWEQGSWLLMCLPTHEAKVFDVRRSNGEVILQGKCVRKRNHRPVAQSGGDVDRVRLVRAVVESSWTTCLETLNENTHFAVWVDPVRGSGLVKRDERCDYARPELRAANPGRNVVFPID